MRRLDYVLHSISVDEGIDELSHVNLVYSTSEMGIADKFVDRVQCIIGIELLSFGRVELGSGNNGTISFKKRAIL